jgi:glutamine cyclotransferase
VSTVISRRAFSASLLGLAAAPFLARVARAANLGTGEVGAVRNPGLLVGPERLRAKIVRTLPHDTSAFTEGLVVRRASAAGKPSFLESTGGFPDSATTASTLREVDLETGSVRRTRTLLERDPNGHYVFGEGLTLFGDKLIQLTWSSKRALIYDARSFEKLREASYDGEGWGLTANNTHLIMSDGSSKIRFRDPETFETVRTIDVQLGGKPLDQLNELEFIEGHIYANRWMTNDIYRIDPKTGEVTAVVSVPDLFPELRRTNPDAVLNGIAYDAQSKKIYITGKLWPNVFEVRFEADR